MNRSLIHEWEAKNPTHESPGVTGLIFSGPCVHHPSLQKNQNLLPIISPTSAIITIRQIFHPFPDTEIHHSHLWSGGLGTVKRCHRNQSRTTGESISHRCTGKNSVRNSAIADRTNAVRAIRTTGELYPSIKVYGASTSDSSQKRESRPPADRAQSVPPLKVGAPGPPLGPGKANSNPASIQTNRNYLTCGLWPVDCLLQTANCQLQTVTPARSISR